MITLNSAMELLDEHGARKGLIIDEASERTTLKDSSECPEPDQIKTDAADKRMFADSMGIQIDTSKMVDTKNGLAGKRRHNMQGDGAGLQRKEDPEIPRSTCRFNANDAEDDDNGRASAVQGNNGCI